MCFCRAEGDTETALTLETAVPNSLFAVKAKSNLRSLYTLATVYLEASHVLTIVSR